MRAPSPVRLWLVLLLLTWLGTPPASAQSGSVHLALGNPSGAVTDVNQPSNYLIDRTQYALSYHRDKGISNWASWHLAATDLGSAPRSTSFTTDTTLPAGWYRVKSSDYTNSGFDRGHMTPSADRTATVDDNKATFIITNVLPQAPDNNQGPWADLESYARSLVAQGNELYIVSGGLGVSGTIAGGLVTVPASVWKVMLVLPDGANDTERTTTATRVIAVQMPNVNGIRSAPWESYLTTTDTIETATGYDFFANVPPLIQGVIEARQDVLTGTATSITPTTGLAYAAEILTDYPAFGVQVREGNGSPVANVPVTFAALGSDATGFFQGGVTTATIATGGDGVAVAPTLTASGIVGGYRLEASIAGVYTPVQFAMFNLPANLTERLYLPLIVR